MLLDVISERRASVLVRRGFQISTAMIKVRTSVTCLLLAQELPPHPVPGRQPFVGPDLFSQDERGFGLLLVLTPPLSPNCRQDELQMNRQLTVQLELSQCILSDIDPSVQSKFIVEMVQPKRPKESFQMRAAGSHWSWLTSSYSAKNVKCPVHHNKMQSPDFVVVKDMVFGVFCYDKRRELICADFVSPLSHQFHQALGWSTCSRSPTTRHAVVLGRSCRFHRTHLLNLGFSCVSSDAPLPAIAPFFLISPSLWYLETLWLQSDAWNGALMQHSPEALLAHQPFVCC